MANTWDPNLYLQFADQRLRPALDLLERVPLAEARVIYDLGCGAGNVTRILHERWPSARITGVDASPDMLQKAGDIPGVRFEQADLAKWRADSPVDLVYSNAALHWIDDHAGLFPRLFEQVASRGYLVVQMPRQHLMPSHQILFELVREKRWTRLAGAIRESPVHDAEFYYDRLSLLASALDIWETEYLHVLEGEDPVLNWLAGSILRPVLDCLDSFDKAAFLSAYAERLRAAYPARVDGKTLLPFLRLFIVAQKR